MLYVFLLVTLAAMAMASSQVDFVYTDWIISCGAYGGVNSTLRLREKLSFDFSSGSDDAYLLDFPCDSQATSYVRVYSSQDNTFGSDQGNDFIRFSYTFKERSVTPQNSVGVLTMNLLCPQIAWQNGFTVDLTQAQYAGKCPALYPCPSGTQYTVLKRSGDTLYLGSAPSCDVNGGLSQNNPTIYAKDNAGERVLISFALLLFASFLLL